IFTAQAEEAIAPTPALDQIIAIVSTNSVIAIVADVPPIAIVIIVVVIIIVIIETRNETTIGIIIEGGRKNAGLR
ncbi:MAG: hypothetical protein AAFY02_22505, partial [Pseudomonadota bacterium]